MAKLLDALAQVESSGRFGIVGPQTKYGRAKGGFQMLDATAQAMARKEGLPWQAHLMTSPTKEGQDYQRRLANAYLQEGLQRTGNVRDALKYYHGGPNRKLWGPKTDAHAEKVLALAGPDAWEESKPMQSQTKPGLAALLANPPMPGVVSGYGGGTFNADGSEATPVQGIAQLMQPQTDAEGNPLAVPNMDAMSLGTVNGRDPLAPKPKFFGKGGMGMYLLGGVADGIAQHFGAKPGFGPGVEAMREDEREQNLRLELYRQKVAAERAERMQPKVLGGNQIGYIGPDGKPVITGNLPQQPTQTDRYMQKLLDPNTPEAERAIIERYMFQPRFVSDGMGGGQFTQPGGDAPSGGAASISSDEEYEALPSGAQFIGPDGQMRRKP
jgi:hypothetical protein